MKIIRIATLLYLCTLFTATSNAYATGNDHGAQQHPTPGGKADRPDQTGRSPDSKQQNKSSDNECVEIEKDYDQCPTTHRAKFQKCGDKEKMNGCVTN